MLIRFLILALLFISCRSGEIACPKVKGVKLRSRPGNYLRNSQQSATASAEEKEKPRFDFKAQNKHVKSAQNIEEWDCPRPGGKTEVPKAVKANIKRNRKKFDEYYRTKSLPDTTLRSSAQKLPTRQR